MTGTVTDAWSLDIAAAKQKGLVAHLEVEERKLTPLGVTMGASRPRGSSRLLS